MTPSDIARWDMAVLRRQVLGARSYRDLTSEVHLENGDRTGYALGLSVGGFGQDTEVQPLRGGLRVPDPERGLPDPRRRGRRVLERGQRLRGGPDSERARPLDPRAGKAARCKRPRPPRSARWPPSSRACARERVDRSLFTSNANSYFSATALADIQASLKPLGAVKETTRTAESLRGGMAFRSYKVVFESGSVVISTYLTTDGHFEQFMVEQDL